MKTLIVILSLLVASLTVHADVAACVRCHSATTTTMPRIDGQQPEYFMQTLRDYASKARHSPRASMMAMQLKNLTETDYVSLASHFAGLPGLPAIAGDAALIAKGQELYANPLPGTTFKTCAECHGANGEGIGINARVAGQIKSFLKLQFANYKANLIDNQPEMHDISATLTDDQVAALVEFMASK